MESPNYGLALLLTGWIFAFITIGVVIARFWVRYKIMGRAQIDDYLILLGLTLALINNGFCTTSVIWGIGTHIAELDFDGTVNSIKFSHICLSFHIIATCVGRISFACLLLSVIPPSKWRRNLLWGIIISELIVDPVTCIISMVQCRPLTGFWNRTIEADCWSPKVQMYTGFIQGSYCSLIDLMLAVFPATLFWNLKMKTSTKISLSVLMGLGIFAMIASIIKTVLLRNLQQKDADITYAMGPLAVAWTLELYLVLIAASIPTLRPLMSLKDHNFGSQPYHTPSHSHSHSQSHNRDFKPWPRQPGTKPIVPEDSTEDLYHKGYNFLPLDQIMPKRSQSSDEENSGRESRLRGIFGKSSSSESDDGKRSDQFVKIETTLEITVEDKETARRAAEWRLDERQGKGEKRYS